MIQCIPSRYSKSVYRLDMTMFRFDTIMFSLDMTPRRRTWNLWAREARARSQTRRNYILDQAQPRHKGERGVVGHTRGTHRLVMIGRVFTSHPEREPTGVGTGFTTTQRGDRCLETTDRHRTVHRDSRSNI